MFVTAVAAVSGRHRRAMASPRPFLLIILLFIAGVSVAADLASDSAALLAFRAAVGGRTLSWNTSSPTPCPWLGVNCSGGRVTELRLPGASLAGPIPAGTLGNLTALRFLSLRFNRLSGPIPSLSTLSDLRGLFLNGNTFSGGIPGTLFSLSKLTRLNLADNDLTGGISPGFNNLIRLSTLLLENNNLSGEIPALSLPALVQFNVSNNNLTGAIPPVLQTMPATAFLGNHLCGGPLVPCFDNGSPAPAPALSPGIFNHKNNHKKNKLSAGAIAGIAIGAAFGALLLLFLLVVCFRNVDNTKMGFGGAAAAEKPRESEVALHDKEATNENDNATALPVSGVAMPVLAPVAIVAGGPIGGNKKLVFLGRVQGFYNLEDLLRASAEVLGKGTTATTYKAMLEMGTVVAVKRLRDMTLPEKEFREKVSVIGSMDHPNLVTLQAYYYSKDEKLLVYEFVPNGSLSSRLHGSRGSGRTPLDWETRLNVALGAARGVEYIHSKGPNVSHGNIKSSNVLLGTSNEPRVSDSGIISLGSSPSPTRAAAGYRAPEVTDIRKVSQRADVYSFGVLLLELLTGKAPSQAALNDEGVDLPRWVQSVVREEWTSEVFDVELLRYQNVEEEMVQLLQLAIDCVVQHPDKRPSMSEVVARIEEIKRSSLTRGQEGDSHDQLSDQTSESAYRTMADEF